MVDDLERAFEARLRPGVVESRAKIKEPHRHDENDSADEKRLVWLPRRGDAKKRRRDHGGGQTESMTDTIRDFFGPGLVPVRLRE